MIEVEGLSKSFGAKKAVSNLSFSIQAGEVIGLLGPNGAGKTTTMRMLTGYFPPDTGTAEIDGVKVGDDPYALRRLVGYLPERVPLYAGQTVEEFLFFIGSARGFTGEALQESMDYALDRCDLEDVRYKLISNISRGYRQRVGLAQAIMHKPKVLILDEPTVGLDPNQVQEIRTLIREVAQESTVILSSHILSEVQALCDRVLILSQGSMVAFDTPTCLAEELDSFAQFCLRLDTEERSEVLQALTAIEGVCEVEYDEQRDCWNLALEKVGKPQAAVVISCVEHQWPVLALEPLKSDLEQVFFSLVDTQDQESDEPDKLETETIEEAEV